ncbi:PAS domain S-box-containing protein [Bacillus mesophilus]|uniref:histidine kinase n=1 Tax=Bacillus mesophilus TaxID=1808955 RepID=A0A6M0Q6K0_9BACI|nr:PAS domain S-box protein [Bacillus mesophilus]MBM7659889.1 PAS domain S-box-containing protein [Bacillus mesophilus]NEY70748.1 PAS domain S-box protein [Bacillus mesophilus]
MEKPKINILMVDDRKENLQALEAVLDSPDYQLIKATSGEEALKWILKKDFAVILLDVQMPGIDGFETARLIRARKKSMEIPIIFITALTKTQDYVLNGYSSGAIDFLFKPFNPFILKSKVEGFVNIYLSQKELQLKNEVILKHSLELDQAYSHLQKSEAISRAIGETSIDAIFTLNEDGRILTSNPAAISIFGYQQEEFNHIADVIPLFSEKPFHPYIEDKSFEEEAKRQDGALFPVEITLSNAIIDQDTIYVCSIRDITERKNHFKQLERLVQQRTEELIISNNHLQTEIDEKLQMVQVTKESEAKYRHLVEDSPLAIFVLEANNEYFSFINNTGVKLLGGQSTMDVLSKKISSFFPLEQYVTMTSRIQDSYDGQKQIGIEEKFIQLDGGVINVEVTIIPFTYMGKPAVHIVANDITTFKRTQEFLGQSEKLAVVGELAAGIAHEIRNPLTSLRGFTQLIEFDQGVKHQYLSIMLTEIDRINTIVSELLLLAKPNDEDFNPVNMNELLKTVVVLMNAQATFHNIEINLHTKDPEPVIIIGLENKLKQIFINFIKNSIEAMPHGGKITIRTVKEEGNFLIEIEDQGCGIPPESLAKIGKPFFTTKEKGTGLGFMICNSIIESHKGKLGITSQVDVGTTITLSFPYDFQEKTLLSI